MAEDRSAAQGRDELPVRYTKLTEADRIAADFISIPFEDHEARKLACAYFTYRDEAAKLLEEVERLRMVSRCNEPSPDGSVLCDLFPDHGGKHAHADGYEWSETRV